MRLQNFANEEFRRHQSFRRLRQDVPEAGRAQRDEGDAGSEIDKVPIKKTYTCNVAEFGWLDQPQNKLRVPMHYVLKNDKRTSWAYIRCPYGKVRIFIDSGGESGTAFLGEDWGRFTPIDDEMKLYLGVAQDIVVKRTIEKNERKHVSGNLFHQEVILKYEIENFKDQAVTLDVVENLRHVRNEVRGDSGRDVEWELGKETTFAGDLTRRRARSSNSRSTPHCRPGRRTVKPRRSRTSSTCSSRTSGSPSSAVRRPLA